ncbi:putative type II restriction enzyme (methylase subunit) [Desulforapulum autotrophicum HRM2]|uniref:site-specific DNA-methyltransferase (adenine-specific) n=2 Tax=Desulforapulum autotrophicum TaxID=2296 RepID=C0QCT5_DESAH|nr:putative type II restriction enzyme (methylase subunit) [Desulforapulum autotrophicum HRM2]
MNIEKLEENVQMLVANLVEETFIYDLLLAYNQPKASITRLQKGDYNLSKNPGEIIWKKKLFFKKETDSDLHDLIDRLKKDPGITKHHPRFIIVTDFKTLLSVDTKTEDTLDVPIMDLSKFYDFFLPWSGMEKSQFQSENPADIKAAERMGKLYDLILEDNPTENERDRHSLNIFLSRLLFCFFAEDTGIFADDQFTNALASHTGQDGRDLQTYFQKFFKVLNLPERSDYPKFLQDFPYVNGGLFADDYPVPTFSTKSRKIIIECGALNWKAINPDIFGSMIQAVVHNDQRSGLGMHYTSVVNIMKVIEPLFLNDLYSDLERAGDNKKKLLKLLDRLCHLRIFDPACGSGNFLIIAYKELCKIEIEIFKQLEGKQLTLFSNIKLTQFYGIELDDFAHETAKLSLWLAEHQMNLAFKEVFGQIRPTLPLKDGGNIVCGNATRLNWEEVCPKGNEIYILGNPPYLGYSLQSKEQKEDLSKVFLNMKKYKVLDYIACWFFLAARYIQKSKAQFAFVSTNSICQGEQAAILWPYLFNLKCEINFAHQSFKWTNNAKGNAGVICIIVGMRNLNTNPKLIFNGAICRNVKNINPYLKNAKNITISKRHSPLSSIPEMLRGNGAVDGGHLSLTALEYNNLLENKPEAGCFLKKMMGSAEFINDKLRYCLWIENDDLTEAQSFTEIRSRIEKVKLFRLNSKKKATIKNALTSHRFAEARYSQQNSIIIPRVSSERRHYIPIGFLKSDTIILDSAFAIYDPPLYIFAIISSRIHMAWVRTVAGRLKTDYRYSSALCYNTFPFPKITEAVKTRLEDHVFKVLDEREQHPEKTLAQLYDPDKMPDGLRQAHHEMDLAVESCYRSHPFKSDEERLEFLFKLYEEMIEAEKS